MMLQIQDTLRTKDIHIFVHYTYIVHCGQEYFSTHGSLTRIKTQVLYIM